MLFFKKMKWYRKGLAKNELSLLILKLSFLADEVREGRAMKADKKYWDLYIERFEEVLKEFNFEDYRAELDSFKAIYEEYILKGEEDKHE